MKEVIETLELYYQPLTQKEKHWDFFLALSDYVGFIISEKILLDILIEEYDKDVAEQAKIRQYEKQCLEELELKKKKLISLTEKSGAKSKELLDAIALLKGTHYDDAESFEGCLFEVARYLSAEKGREIVKEFIVSDAEYKKYSGANSNQYGNFIFSKTLSTKHDLEHRYKSRRKIEVWQSIEALFTAYKVIVDGDQLKYNFEKEYAKKEKMDPIYRFIKSHTFLFAFGDVRRLNDYVDFGFDPEIDGLNYLEFEKFKMYAGRVHLFLINQYRKRHNKTEIREVKFDEYKSVLLIGIKPIKLTKFSNQYHFLKIMFQKPEKDWQYSEISELMDPLNKRPWKQLYDVASAIKSKIAIKTGIEDFLITTTQSTQINKKYLS